MASRVDSTLVQTMTVFMNFLFSIISISEDEHKKNKDEKATEQVVRKREMTLVHVHIDSLHGFE